MARMLVKMGLQPMAVGKFGAISVTVTAANLSNLLLLLLGEKWPTYGFLHALPIGRVSETS